MNAKNNKRSARVSSKKVAINNDAKELTSQAGLVPVVNFLRKCGMIGLINEEEHERGANALYDSVIFFEILKILSIGMAVLIINTTLKTRSMLISIGE